MRTFLPFVALCLTCVTAQPLPVEAASLEENLRLASMTIFGSRFCKNANLAKVRYIVAGAMADAEKQGVSPTEFKAAVAREIAMMLDQVREPEKICAQLLFFLH